MEIHFTEALAATINVVLYAEFDNVIEIDRNRHILLYNLRFESRIVTFGGNLSSAHVQCHNIDLVVSKIERDFRNSPI
jgi:hypothetical protein